MWPFRHRMRDEVRADWQQHRGAIASHDLPLDQWTDVAAAFTAIDGVYGFAADHEQRPPEPSSGINAVAFISGEIGDTVSRALVVLRKLADGGPSQHRRRGPRRRYGRLLDQRGDA